MIKIKQSWEMVRPVLYTPEREGVSGEAEVCGTVAQLVERATHGGHTFSPCSGHPFPTG